MSKVPLSFKPTEEEEEYLEETGKLDSWTTTIRDWIRRDKQLNKKQLMDKAQNSFVLLFMGILCFALAIIIPSINMLNLMLIALLVSVSAISVTWGSISILWELYLNARR